MRLRKGLASRCWENMILAMMGEQFMVGDEICGAVISVRFQVNTRKSGCCFCFFLFGDLKKKKLNCLFLKDKRVIKIRMERIFMQYCVIS